MINYTLNRNTEYKSLVEIPLKKPKRLDKNDVISVVLSLSTFRLTVWHIEKTVQSIYP